MILPERYGGARSARMRFTTLHTNNPTTVNNTPIITASHQWKRHASTSPHPTPIGVIVNNNGFAIRMTFGAG